MKWVRPRVRNLFALVVVLTLVALLFSLPPTPPHHSPRVLLLPEPPSLTLPPEATQALAGDGTQVLTPNTNTTSTTKSPLEAALEEAQKEPGPEAQLGGELDNYVQDYIPENFVEVPKEGVKVDQKSNHRKRRPQVSTDKYSPTYLKERVLTFSRSSGLWVFLREQERRVKHASLSCLSLPPNMVDVRAGSRGPPVSLLSAKDFLFDRKNFLTFCPVYKAASTSWTIIMLQLAGFWKDKGPKKGNFQKLVRQVYPRINGLSAYSMTSDTTRFMIVRHPFERLVSCYRDKFEFASKEYYYMRYGENMVSRYRKFSSEFLPDQLHLLMKQVRSKVAGGKIVFMPDNPYANPLGPTFPEFVSFVIDAKSDDEHWRPTNIQCASCSMDYDFILRFESLNKEGRMMLEYLNRTRQVAPRWDNPNLKDKTGDVACEYFNKLSVKQVNDLYSKYYTDFLLYEYSPEHYRECANDYHLLNRKNSTVINTNSTKQLKASGLS